MENPKELIKSGENDLENISFSYFIINYDIIGWKWEQINDLKEVF